MVISANERTLINEMLGAFEGGTFDWFQYNDRVTGEITSVPLTNQLSFSNVQTRLGTIFTAIEAASDDRETEVQAIVAEYKRIRFDVVRIGPGGGGGAAGARYDPTDKRAHMKDLLERNLGLQIRQTGSGAQTGRSFMIIR